MSEPAIVVRGVSKDFMLPHLRRNTIKSYFVSVFRERRVMEVQHALRDIDLEVRKGEFFGVVGRNGSGKSTLLKILAGIYRPTSGTVVVNGRLVPFIELGVGFNAELTGRENVYLNAALMGFAPDEVDAIYDDVVAFAELEGYMDQKLKNYSSGMQVRIAFSLATRARGEILLVDEVLAVGDAAFQRKCFEHFRALKHSETTIVFVTHNMDAVREFCDRAILIEESRVVAEGKADEVAEQYTRLFNAAPVEEEAPAHPDQPPESRWGEGQVRFEKIKVSPVCKDGEDLVIDLEAVARKDVDEAVYGFLICNSAGTALIGTNSRIKKVRCGGLKAGQRVHMRWRVPNVFADGRHTIDLAISDGPSLVIYEYWKEAAWFTVVKDEKTPFPLTPDMSFSFGQGGMPSDGPVT
ncbi:MAG TPA: ABC transporter ATP-binding protein [Thermoleophilia bacterium]|nr:ABC transporter ATP-binding protein [Thermoleophilia bacterium]